MEGDKKYVREFEAYSVYLVTYGLKWTAGAEPAPPCLAFLKCVALKTPHSNASVRAIQDEPALVVIEKHAARSTGYGRNDMASTHVEDTDFCVR